MRVYGGAMEINGIYPPVKLTVRPCQIGIWKISETTKNW